MTIDELNKQMGNPQRFGFTTGTAATAAAMGAAYLYLNELKMSVEVGIPYGIELSVPLKYVKKEDRYYICGVIKDAGDDPDVTDGILISTRLEFIPCDSKGSIEFHFFAGEGVGTVTKDGLDQKKGEPAINSTPRQMIMQNLIKILVKYGYSGVVNITVLADNGINIAKKTFNERLGITGGISILGTSGLVMPMSKSALLETIEADIKFRIKNSSDGIIYMSPGNIGAKYLENFGVDSGSAAIISNFIGESIDMAVSNGAKGFVLSGDMGKLIKLAGGIMNTHSNDSDCRLEILASALLKYGTEADSYTLLDTAREVLKQKTTKAAIEIIKTRKLDKCFAVLAEQMLYYAYNRAFKAEVLFHKDRSTSMEEFKKRFSIEIVSFSDNSTIIRTGELRKH